MKNATYDFTEDILIVSLCGEIDHHSAASVRREIDESMNAFRAKNLILDYSAVSFMDSSGIGLVMGRFREIQLTGGTVRALHANERVRKILKISGVSRVIEVVPEKTWKI